MKITYRPEIDGLRAIAVGAVILYHSQITIFGYQPFKGGFIGVDIFFVISGYLITSIILKELVTTGSFSFKYFYERRIRRILPALIFVMLVSFPFAWMYLLPSDFIDFSKSILYSLGFSSNYYFWYSGQSYGAESGFLKPFLHTWSLSLEEQYYILFPVVLLITFKYFRKYLIHILILGFVISLGLAEWTSRNYSSASFYFLHTRMWELLAGSILAYFEIMGGGGEGEARFKYKILNLILPSVGLFIIGYSILFFNDKMFHPSFHTLSPIIGVCFIIWFSNKNELTTKILSTKLFVGIGLVSYSLYLWHYPVFAFVRGNQFFIEGNIINKIIIVLVTFTLSIISYYSIEKPFRNGKNNFLKILVIISTSILILIIFNLKSIYDDGFKKRNHFPEVISNTLEKLNYRENSQNGLACHNRLGDKGFCIFNDLSDNEGDIVLLGDSLTDSLLSNLIEQVSNTKYRLIHMGYSGNLFLPNFVSFDKKIKKITSDENIHNFRKEFLENKTHKNTYVIIYGDYNYYFEKRIQILKNEIVEYETSNLYSTRDNIFLEYEKRKIFLKEKINLSLINLSKSKKVLLLYPSPISAVNILNHVKINRINISKDTNFYLKDKVNYSINFFRNYNSEIFELFNEIESENLYKIKLESIFCPKNKCIFYDNKNLYIFDTVHPSYEGSKKISDLIMKEIEKIELKSN
jgi:peptidoglycan/LPS O-acetylase OafA/YrhL